MTAMAAQPGSGIAHDPRWLAAGAGGFLAAAAELWLIRGLPGGMLMGWFASLPVLAAGFAAGPVAAIGAGGLAGVLLWLVSGPWPVLHFAALAGLPGMALPLLAMRPQGFVPGGAMVFFGLYPLLLLGWGAMEFAAYPGGVMGMLADSIRQAMQEFPALAVSETMQARVARLIPVLLALWLAVITSINAMIAQRLLARRGFALLPSLDLAAVRLPFWYALLPPAAAGVWLMDLDDGLRLAVFLILLLPFFFQGLAGVHRRSAGLRGRGVALTGFYVLMVYFLPTIGPAVVALGLYDQWARRAPRGGNPT